MKIMINTIYIGDPQRVPAMTPSSRNLAKPKSPVISVQLILAQKSNT